MTFFLLIFSMKISGVGHCCTDGGQTDGLDYAAGDGVDPVFVAHLVDHVICGSVVQIGPRFRETEDNGDLQELRLTE